MWHANLDGNTEEKEKGKSKAMRRAPSPGAGGGVVNEESGGNEVASFNGI